MGRSIDLALLLESLTREHDSLLQEREVVRAEEQRFTRLREELDRKISGLQQSLQGLSLYSTARDEPARTTDEIGGVMGIINRQIGQPVLRARTLIECCREILNRKGDWMSALDVRQGLHAARFDFSEYKSNPLSSIHTTLKRIAESGQAWSEPVAGENLYRWKKSGETAPPPVSETR